MAQNAYPDAVAEVRVVLVDDDYWTRTAMAQELDRHPQIAVVDSIDQTEAVLWPPERWEDVDLAIVDVFDEQAPSEIGTDVFSGITALNHLRTLPVQTLAITPHCQHPLVRLRIHQAEADWLYHRWEVKDLDRLADVVLFPQPDHRPIRPSDQELAEHGAANARANTAVSLYAASDLYPLVQPDVGLKTLRLPRRAVDNFRRRIHRTGFSGTEDLDTSEIAHRVPRWPDVRDYLLSLLGRRDVPPTEVDREDGPIHPS